MEKLKFKIKERFSIPGNMPQPYQVPVDTREQFEVRINDKYRKYIKAINNCNGYIEIGISQDGRSLISHKPIADNQTLDDIHDDPELN